MKAQRGNFPSPIPYNSSIVHTSSRVYRVYSLRLGICFLITCLDYACSISLLVILLDMVPSLLLRVLYSSCAFMSVLVSSLVAPCSARILYVLCPSDMRSYLGAPCPPLDTPKPRADRRLLYRNFVYFLHTMKNKQDPSMCSDGA